MRRWILCLLLTTMPALTWAQSPGEGMFQQYDVRATDVPPGFKLAVQQKYACDPAVMKPGILGFQLSEESALWQIPCQRHASQTAAAYALVYLPSPEENLEFLDFQPPAGHKRTGDPGLLSQPEWTVKTRTVTGTSMGAGGDCGVLERYRVTPEGHFRLIEWREKADCDGKPTKPGQFPLVFRAK